MATAATLVATVREVTHQVYTDGDGPVSDAAILLFANEEYPLVRRMIARIDPDLFATRSAALVVAEGGTEIDVSALTGLDLIFEVEKLYGTRYRTVLHAGPDPEGSAELVWRRRGSAAVELYPVSFAPGTYRLRYMATATELAGAGAILLPAGAERVLTESVAARVKQDKLERDGSAHIRARDLILATLAAQLGPTNHVIRPRVP